MKRGSLGATEGLQNVFCTALSGYIEGRLRINSDDTLVGVAATINFGTNLSVTALSAGIVTISASDTGITSIFQDSTPPKTGENPLKNASKVQLASGPHLDSIFHRFWLILGPKINQIGIKIGSKIGFIFNM